MDSWVYMGNKLPALFLEEQVIAHQSCLDTRFLRKVLPVVIILLSELRATNSYKTLLDPRI